MKCSWRFQVNYPAGDSKVKDWDIFDCRLYQEIVAQGTVITLSANEAYYSAFPISHDSFCSFRFTKEWQCSKSPPIFRCLGETVLSCIVAGLVTPVIGIVSSAHFRLEMPLLVFADFHYRKRGEIKHSRRHIFRKATDRAQTAGHSEWGRTFHSIHTCNMIFTPWNIAWLIKAHRNLHTVMAKV